MQHRSVDERGGEKMNGGKTNEEREGEMRKEEENGGDRARDNKRGFLSIESCWWYGVTPLVDQAS